jgi:ATP-binding cassette subfamily F protein 3
MIVLAADSITKYYGAEPVLLDATLQVRQGQKVALVGPNGSGKTTLLKVLTGALDPDEGRVIRQKEAKLGYQSQEFIATPGQTVLEAGLAIFRNLAEMEQRMRELEAEITHSHTDELMEEYSQVSHDFEVQGGYQYPSRTRSILKGLGFDDDEFEQLVDTLSGGQQSRLALARLLLTEPDILILDEPTNHLDIEAIKWLEEHLKGYSGGLLMVSHDRRFIATLADTVYELDRCRLEHYPGNYAFYRKERALRREQWQKEYEAQRDYIKKTQDFIARNIAGQNTKQAQSRRKELEKLERIAPPPQDNLKVRMTFAPRRDSGRVVLECRKLAMSFEGKPVFRNISFELEKGTRAGLIGPNGCGKTTVLEIICGQETPEGGDIRLGHHVDLAYYSQKRIDLDPEKTAADEIWAVRPLWNRGQVQGLLARFLFRGDDAFKYVRHMSGGEAGRLALTKLLLSEANFLVLDEPTNHLDIDSKEVLEEALDDFPGTVLVVSHDRWFLNRVTDTTLEMTPDKVTAYPGNYDYYLEKKQLLALRQAQNAKAAPVKSPQPAPEPKPELKPLKLSPNEIFRRTKRLEDVELTITRTEERLAELQEDLQASGSDHQLLQELSVKLEHKRQNLEDLYTEWNALTEELSES